MIRTVPVKASVERRGLLASLEFSRLPFRPLRAFVITGVPAKEVRGNHAHRRCAQALWVVRGAFRVRLTDRQGVSDEKILPANEAAIYVPAWTWVQLWAGDQGDVLLVLASLPYDESDYVRDPGEFFGPGKDAPPA